MSLADRIRLWAHHLAESGRPRWLTELLQYSADALEWLTRGAAAPLLCLVPVLAECFG